jgi:CTD kinase subunit alpha
MPSTHSLTRDDAMKDSWSHGDGRRDRGRAAVDRGVIRSRRSPSPIGRRTESEREAKARGRSAEKARLSRPKNRDRDYSDERRRQRSRSPATDSREDVRERNKGRELLDTRVASKSKRSERSDQSSSKRHKSRSPSRDRTERKRSRRGGSRSPTRLDSQSATSDRKPPREQSPSKPRSSGHRVADTHVAGHSKDSRTSDTLEKRRHSPLPRRDKPTSRERIPSSRHGAEHRKRSRSQDRGLGRRSPSRRKSPHISEDVKRRHNSPDTRRRSPEVDRYAPSNSRHRSPPLSGPRGPRLESPHRSRGRRSPREEHRTGPTKAPRPSKGAPKASGANSIEVNMSARGNFGQAGGFHNPNQQMQAAFPLKPQFNQGPRPQVDTRQFSQSPQHMTPNSSYHGSPHGHSPYSAGRGGGWNGPQQQFSPQQ